MRFEITATNVRTNLEETREYFEKYYGDLVSKYNITFEESSPWGYTQVHAFVEIKSLKDFLEFHKDCKCDLVISEDVDRLDDRLQDVTLEIYDGYRE